ncbi:uncharacterized protein TNCT_709601 [Trichonephila clavata]|uniref:Uncharacterized protein n=1 Tax=Trichonephila clavata TaxID=2740835 RepID=A0A8X6GM31_TRICU|nr:uncharacterized protein TNCT_709601 [Trichonephila clavata]
MEIAPSLSTIGQKGNGVERSPQNSISGKTTEILVTLLFLRPLHKHDKHNGRVEVQPYTTASWGFRNGWREIPTGLTERISAQERNCAPFFL